VVRNWGSMVVPNWGSTVVAAVSGC